MARFFETLCAFVQCVASSAVMVGVGFLVACEIQTSPAPVAVAIRNVLGIQTPAEQTARRIVEPLFKVFR